MSGIGFEACGTIRIIDDSKVEDVERFSFTLISNDPVDFAGANGGVCLITDDDGKQAACMWRLCRCFVNVVVLML